MKRIVFAAAIFIFSLPAFADVNSDLDELTAETGLLKNDIGKISGFINSELTKQIILNGTAGAVFPSAICGFPGVEFGGGIGISAGKFNAEGLSSLKYEYLPRLTRKAQISQSRFRPAGAFHLKSGFFLFGKNTDLGLRFLALDFGINQKDVSLRAALYFRAGTAFSAYKRK